MTDDEIRAVLCRGLKKIAPESDPAALAPTENVRAALEIDSFDFLNFLIGLHEEVGVEIPEADYGKLTTIEKMVSYLAPKVA